MWCSRSLVQTCRGKNTLELPFAPGHLLLFGTVSGGDVLSVAGKWSDILSEGSRWKRECSIKWKFVGALVCHTVLEYQMGITKTLMECYSSMVRERGHGLLDFSSVVV